MITSYHFPFRNLSDSELVNLNSTVTQLDLPSPPIQSTLDIAELETKTFKQFELPSDAYLAESDPITFLNSEMQLTDPSCDYVFPDQLDTVKLQINAFRSSTMTKEEKISSIGSLGSSWLRR